MASHELPPPAGRRTAPDRARRLWLALLSPLSLPLIAGCGGADSEAGRKAADSSDAAAGTPDKAALATLANAGERAAVRRARAWQRRGITAMAIAPDGNGGAIADAQGRILLLDSGAAVHKILRQTGGPPITGLVFNDAGTLLLAASSDSLVQGWNLASGTLRLTLRGHEHGVRAVAAPPDGNLIASAGEEARIFVWGGRNGRLLSILHGHGDFVNTLAFSPDGRWLASGDAEARILLWRTSDGALVETLRGHADEVNGLAFQPGSEVLASAGEDGKLLLWNPRSGRQLQTLQGHAGALRCLAFNGNGKVLAAGGADGSVKVWHLASGRLLQSSVVSTSPVTCLDFLRNNPNRLFVGAEDGQVRLVNLANEAGS
jgi:WD40 repeat protein